MRTDDLGAVVRLYNDAVAAIPCNWPLTETEFADALLGNGTLSSRSRRLDPETVYVAGAAGTPLGFVDFTLTGGNELIRFLAFPPQRPEVGAALLTAALRHLCRAGCTHVEAAAHATWHRMSALCRHPAAARHGYITELGTAERYRRQGLGSTLMQQMIHDMHHAGVTEATLHTMYDNVPTIRPVHPARVPLPRHQHHPAQAAGSERRKRSRVRTRKRFPPASGARTGGPSTTSTPVNAPSELIHELSDLALFMDDLEIRTFASRHDSHTDVF